MILYTTKSFLFSPQHFKVCKMWMRPVPSKGLIFSCLSTLSLLGYTKHPVKFEFQNTEFPKYCMGYAYTKYYLSKNQIYLGIEHFYLLHMATQSLERTVFTVCPIIDSVTSESSCNTLYLYLGHGTQWSFCSENVAYLFST